MKIPKKIKVGGKVYAVITDYVFRERSDVAGQADHDFNQIRLAGIAPGGGQRPRANIEHTFIHELLHCVDTAYNARELSEGAVDRLSSGLYQVLNDNGLLAEDGPPALSVGGTVDIGGEARITEIEMVGKTMKFEYATEVQT